LKIAGRQNFPLVGKLTERFERALKQGLTVTADQYPYTAGSTMLGAILPPWAHDGGPNETLKRLHDPAARRRMRAQMEDTAPQDWDSFWKWTGAEGIVISDVPSGRRPELLGKSILEAARLAGREAEAIEVAFDLLRDEELGVGMISHSQNEACVRAFARLPFVNGGTDALLGGRPHPRAYGTYPRFLGRFVREERLLSLEEMVRKLTSQAARAMNLRGVGEVKPGYAADLAVFDAARIEDRATFAEPMASPEGISYVVVRGQVAVEAGEPTGIRAGRVVRRTEAVA
jgi:N-acyl-D-amino-acid deacylase